MIARRAIDCPMDVEEITRCRRENSIVAGDLALPTRDLNPGLILGSRLKPTDYAAVLRSCPAAAAGHDVLKDGNPMGRRISEALALFSLSRLPSSSPGIDSRASRGIGSLFWRTASFAGGVR
jgi:hypothetical protein